MKIIKALQQQRQMQLPGNLYAKTQVVFAFRNGFCEGSKLTLQQVQYMYDTDLLKVEGESVCTSDLLFMKNHFVALDYIVDHAEDDLNFSFFLQLRAILPVQTSEINTNLVDSTLRLYQKMVHPNLNNLLDLYQKMVQLKVNRSLAKLVLFKECLKWDIMPFILPGKQEFSLTKEVEMLQNEYAAWVEKFLEKSNNFLQNLQ